MTKSFFLYGVLANSSAVRFRTAPHRLGSSIPSAVAISQVHVYTYVQKMSCVNLYAQ